MKKLVFMNFSPNKCGNTFRIGQELLENVEYDVLQMSDYKISQYGQVFEDDQISDVFKKIEDKDVILIGAPIYWYTVGGILKTFIDRLYLLKEAEVLRGKELYFFAQGSSPDENSINTIEYLVKRFSYLMGMKLKNVIVDSSQGCKVISDMTIYL